VTFRKTTEPTNFVGFFCRIRKTLPKDVKREMIVAGRVVRN
jgi:hypothetical protein